ncbi:MAG: hypothetical protein GY772_29260 [bacterium]|nr:hypothetical protein [bacterium]
MAKRKAGGSPGSHYKCKYGRLKTRTRGPNGGWRYCKKKPKCAKGARAQAKKVASGRSSAPYQRNTFQGPCRWGRLVSPVKLPGGGMRFCKLKPRDAQAAPARKQIDERRGPFHNIERMAAAAAAQAAAEQGEWQGPCQWGRLKTPVQEADGRMRHCKLRPMPSGWQDLIAKR